MVKVPEFTPTTPVLAPAPSRVGVAGAEGRAEAELAGAIGQAITTSADVIRRRQEIEQNAERTLKALEYDRELTTRTGEFAEGFRERQDYENFEPDTEKFLTDLKNEYSEKIGGDKTLQIAFERKFNQQFGQMTRTAKAKKFEVMTNRALGTFETGFNESLQDYAREADPNFREIIKNGIEIDTASLVSSGFMTQAQAEDKIQKFNDQAEDVRADQMIETDAIAAEEALKTGDFDELDPKVRQDKIEKTQLRQKQNVQAEKIAIAAEEAREKKALKEAHDDEERNLGELFLTEDYDAVVPFLTQSKHLTGDELRTWSAAAATKAKSIGKVVDKTKQAAEIVTINQMITSEEDPTKIRNYILTNDNLTTDNQEQYINKLETKLTGEVSKGVKDGYDLISGVIIPKRGVSADLLQTPLETAAVASAQLDLDDWIDEQQKAGKVLTYQDIKRKSLDLGQSHQIPFHQQILFEVETGKRLAAEGRKAAAVIKAEKEK